MDFTITIDGKEHNIFTILEEIKQKILEYESKYQQILDIIMEKEQ